MRKRRLFLNIAFAALTLASCSIDGVHESLLLSERSDSGSSLSASPSSSDTVSASSGSIGSSSRSSYERNPFSIRSSSDRYTVSIYQSYYLKRGDDGNPVYGNPRYDFSVTVEAGGHLYSNAEEYDDLIEGCNESYSPNGGAYSIIGFYLDATCKHDISYSYTVNSDINAYYYCKG